MKVRQDDLQTLLQESLTRNCIAGASIAILNEGDVIAAAAGVTNVTTGVEMTPDTVMHIGSITKVFNATLVMQLVDEGKVDLDESVSAYLPDLRLKDREALEQITVKMLLNHTSGIDGEMMPDHGHDEETIEKGIARFAELGQLFRPGAEFSYCNAATVIAGYLTQRLTGKGWYRLVKEKIFDRLGMDHAATLPEEALLHRASVGHHFDPGSKQLMRTSFAFLPLSWAPCGTTLMTSARDLIAFARTHMALGVGPNGTRILSVRSAQAMQQMTVNNSARAALLNDIGLGWMIPEHGLLFHSGGGPGIGSVLYVHPQRQWAAVLLTNSDNCLGLIIELLEPWLQGAVRKSLGVTDVHLPTESVDIDPRRYVGVYEDMSIRYRVSSTPDGLTLSSQPRYAWSDTMSTDETPFARLIPLSAEKFLREPTGRDDESPAAFRLFTFKNPDAQGQMTHLGFGVRLLPRVCN